MFNHGIKRCTAKENLFIWLISEVIVSKSYERPLLTFINKENQTILPHPHIRIGALKICKRNLSSRNFDADFGRKGVSSNPCSDVYPGKQAFSEKNTQAMRDYLLKHKRFNFKKLIAMS